MNILVHYVCVLTFAVLCSSKDLHIKEERDLLKKDNGLPEIYKNGMSHTPERLTERFVRHVETTDTETVLQHLMKEINRKYPETRPGSKNSTMPKLIRKLKSKLRKQIKKNKNIKRKKMASKAHPKIDNFTTTINNVV
ncbi:uncharacterized protein LOC128680446 [Plodia interpunctella]|uniref:uncharacterized protein LOC128680446 n=1 Tax=Plodia interpunctella TaxID=58824 RepID=UPI00236812AE|nr:uncharacterized protein LOC128680446 [Plodia interpunctella]